MPIDAYGLHFEDPFASRKAYNDARVGIALSERKRQQDLADAAALFDRQLSKQAAFEQLRLNAVTEQDRQRIDAQEAAADRHLAAQHNFNIEQRALDREARRQEDADKWQQFMDKEVYLIQREDAKQQAMESRMEGVKDYESKIRAAVKKEEVDQTTANYAFFEAQEERLKNRILTLETLPVSYKNRAIYDGLIQAGISKKKLLEAGFNPESTTDNTGKLRALNLNPKQATDVGDALTKARTEYRADTDLERADLYQKLKAQEANRHSLLPKIDVRRLDEFRPDWLKGYGSVPQEPGLIGPPAPAEDRFQTFKREQLGAEGQKMFGGNAPASPGLPATTQATPQEFLTVPGERGAIMPMIEDITGPVGDIIPGIGRQFKQSGREISNDFNYFVKPPVTAIAGAIGSAGSGIGSFVYGTPPTKTGIQMDDFVGWLANNEPSLTGKNQMVIKAIIANPVNRGRLTNWITKYQQSQGVTQQGQQMFAPAPAYAPSQSEVDNPEFNQF